MKWRRDLPQRKPRILLLKEKGCRAQGREVPSTLYPWTSDTHILHIQANHTFSKLLPNLTHFNPGSPFWGLGSSLSQEAGVARPGLNVHAHTRLLTSSQGVGSLGLLAFFRSQQHLLHVTVSFPVPRRYLRS